MERRNCRQADTRLTRSDSRALFRQDIRPKTSGAKNRASGRHIGDLPDPGDYVLLIAAHSAPTQFPPLLLRNGAVDLSRRGLDVGIEAQWADELLQRGECRGHHAAK